MSDQINVTFNSHVHEQLNKLDDIIHGPGVSKLLLVFNKTSGAFMGIVAGHLHTATKHDTTFYKYKEISFDPTLYEWRGDCDTGGLVELNEAPVRVGETQIDDQTSYTIRDVYDWYHQNNAMMAVLEKLIKANDLKGEEVESFKEILEYISARRESAQKFKDAYKENPDFQYESKKEIIEQMSAQLDGGLHELLGTKPNQLPHDSMAAVPDVKEDNIWMINKTSTHVTDSILPSNDG